MDDYPKWVQLESWIGSVLVLSADEESAVLADWAKRSKAATKAYQASLNQDVPSDPDQTS